MKKHIPIKMLGFPPFYSVEDYNEAQAEIEKLRQDMDDVNIKLGEETKQLQSALDVAVEGLEKVSAYFDTEDEGSHSCDYSTKLENRMTVANSALEKIKQIRSEK